MDTLNQKRVWSGLGSVLFVSLLACLFTACNDKIDVQQAFPFTVETMPVPTRLVLGETAEIRCELKRAGRFEDARYTIRYFQPDGKGSLLLDNGMKLLPNDRYPLDREVFRLYYTSRPSTSISRTMQGRWHCSLSPSTMKMKRKRRPK